MYKSLPESSATVYLLCSNILIGTLVSNTLVYAIPLLNVRAKKNLSLDFPSSPSLLTPLHCAKFKYLSRLHPFSL